MASPSFDLKTLIDSDLWAINCYTVMTAVGRVLYVQTNINNFSFDAHVIVT